MHEKRTFNILSYFQCYLTLRYCVLLYNWDLKLDSYFIYKYPQKKMSEKELIENKELVDLEQKYQEILSNEPESNTFCLLADVQYKLGKIDKATGVLIRGLGYNKDNVTAHFLLGKIYYERWLIDQAKKEMEKVLKLAPDNLQAAILLSQIYKSEDKIAEALNVLEGVYVFHSSDNDLNEKIEEIKIELSIFENKSSMSVFETPIESRKLNQINLDPSPAQSEVFTETMLNLYLQQGQFDKAREAIEEIYKNEDEKIAAIENLEKTKLNKVNISAGFVSKD
ncbi:MAG: hypothetical protein DHS20C13_17030 [Thermodesulfobacteriota bacterium]|nr:MAG: hypothetical protein DHS20C13_17030 [Thermodesulfobacteriota bacterium]